MMRRGHTDTLVALDIAREHADELRQEVEALREDVADLEREHAEAEDCLAAVLILVDWVTPYGDHYVDHIHNAGESADYARLVIALHTWASKGAA